MNRLSNGMKCPHCGNEINIGSLLGSATSKAKARAARRNAKLGGWPKGKKRGKRKPSDPNVIAHNNPTVSYESCKISK